MTALANAMVANVAGFRDNLNYDARSADLRGHWEESMLELLPTCEHCNKPLPPNSTQAAICSFECTFCARCVAEVLENVCPNCGGNFCSRPVRPTHAWKGTANLQGHPASSTIKHRPVDLAAHRELLARMGRLAPEQR